MTISTHPKHECAGTGPGHRPDTMEAFALADTSAPAIWPLLPPCAARALSVALLLVMAAGVLLAGARGAHAQSTDILISNGDPPPSARLLVVNMTQRYVAQEFTTGPHPAGYDIRAVAVRTESSRGKQDMGLQGRIRSRRWEPVGEWNIMLPHRQMGPTLMRSRPVADADWSWFVSPEPIHLAANESYFFELVCRWGCFDVTNAVGLGLTESNDEDDVTLPGWSMADGFMIQNARFNHWWGDMVVGTDGFFHPNPQGPVLRLAISGVATAFEGMQPGDAEVPKVSASDVRVREAPEARLAFPVKLSGPSARAVTVRYETADGTATAGTDYVAASGRLVFAPGQTVRTVYVPVLHDSRREGAETLTLRLSGVTGARLADREATGTIVNAGPKPREWMARFGRSGGWRMVEAVDESNQGVHPLAYADETAPPSQDDEGTGNVSAARGAAPVLMDSGRVLVGARGARFGAMPIPPHAPTTGWKSDRAVRGPHMTLGLRLALSEPMSRWGTGPCGNR